MSLEWPGSTSDVLPALVSRTAPSDAASTTQNRQFKHFIVTVDDERFQLNRKRIKRNRVRVACFECSSRKVKCSGCRPVCKGCQKSHAKCVYRNEEDALSQPITDSEDINREEAFCQPRANYENGNGENLPSLPDNDSIATEKSTSDDHTDTPPTPTVQSPDYFASLNEYLGYFSNGSMENPQQLTSPKMIAMSPSSVFSSHTAIPRLGSHIDSREPTKLRIPYFRWFGPTGIVPGFTRVLVDLRQAGSEKSVSTTSSPTDHTDSPTAHIQTESEVHQTQSEEQSEDLLFDHEDKMVPNAQILDHLLILFFDFFGSHFPFYQRDQFMESIRSKSVPAVLLNSMCALACRYSHHPSIRREPIYMCGEIFGDKAKQLLIILLAVPSYDLVASLLMLSWYEFGCNRDVGFWMYTGMAIRMAQDLGMHRGNEEGLRSGKTTPPEGDFSGGFERYRENGDSWKDDEESSLQLNLFWSIYFIDRIISLGTGRPLTLRDDEISCPLPPDGSSELDKTISPSPFPHMIRIMIIQGKANEEISTIRQPEDLTDAKRHTLFKLQDQIIQIYTNLDPRLSFKASNFRNYVSLGLGGSFLLLHVWFHAVIITLHRPGLMFGKDTLAHKLGKDSLEVSMSSANTITAILDAAELIDDKTITGTPFINQAIYIAGLAFIAESEMHGQHLTTSPGDQINESVEKNIDSSTQSFQGENPSIFSVPTTTSTSTSTQFSGPTFPSTFAQPFPPPSSSAPTFRVQSNASTALLQSATKRNYQICLNTITTLKASWRGIGWILGTMEQKAKGIVLTDPSEESVDPASKIDLRDAGMLQRLLAVNNRRSGRRHKGYSSAVLHPITGVEMGEAWDLSGGRSQAWSSYGLAQNGFGIGDGWMDLAWVDADALTASNAGIPNVRQGNGRYDLQNRVCTLE